MPIPTNTQKTVALSSNRDQLKIGSVAYNGLNLSIKPHQVMILLQEMGAFLADVNLAAQILSVPTINDVPRNNKHIPQSTNYHSPYLPTFLHSVKVHKNPTTSMVNNALMNSIKVNGTKREFYDLTAIKCRMLFDNELYANRANPAEIKKFASARAYKVIKGERDTVIEYRYATFLQHLISVEKIAIGTSTGGGLTKMTYMEFDFNKCMERFIDNSRPCETVIKCGPFNASFGENQQNEIRFFLEVITKLIPSVLQFITDRISRDEVLAHARANGSALTMREYTLAIDNLDSSSPYYSAIINDLNSITNIDPRTGCGVRVKDVNYIDIRKFLQKHLPGVYSVLYTSRNVVTNLI